MPRYIVERTVAEGWPIPIDDCRGVLERNAEEGVTWIQSYVSDESCIAFCVYDAPTEEMVREHADHLGDHTVVAVYEIAGDVTPDDFPLD